MKVIVGLGNPGKSYERTRHNVGFMVVDEIAGRLGKPRLCKKTRDFVREDYRIGSSELILIKPLLYMNLSGEALRKTGLNWPALIGETLVVYDESALEFGKLRIRRSGSAGGHKGLKNIIDCFASQEIPRLRVGIGRDPEMLLADFVLKPFTGAERKLLPDIISNAADAALLAATDGLEAAMRAHNGGKDQENE